MRGKREGKKGGKKYIYKLNINKKCVCDFLKL
jgi:predicted transcriptional regulator